MAKYVLPDLSYDYGALEPHISGKIMELHHGKHHQAYVKGANDTLEALEEARHQRSFTSLAGLERSLAFNTSGHVLHSMFWQNLSPDGGEQPTGELSTLIKRDFGGFEELKAQLTEAAVTTQGSGWAMVLWEPLSARLLIAQIHDHQSETIQGSVPLMVLDAWEHAYYLQYGPGKASYFKAIWNVWNWEDITARFEAAQRSDLVLRHTVDTPRTPREAPPAQH